MAEESFRNPAPADDERVPRLVNTALHILDTGDAPGLREILRKDPSLVRARPGQSDLAGTAYFTGATLLHYVAGNPFRKELPPSTVEVARVLLAAGAPVDGRTEAGNTTLTLVVSSAEARRAGVQLPLIDLLVDAGADPNIDGGSPLHAALIHGETAAARALVRYGATLDVRFSAGLGELDVLLGCYDAHSALLPGSCLDTARSREKVEGEALLLAAINGQIEVIEFYLRRGTDVNALLPGGATLLHNAAWYARAALVEFLLHRGADAFRRDDQYGGTPLDWVRHREQSRTTPADHSLDLGSVAALLDLSERLRPST